MPWRIIGLLSASTGSGIAGALVVSFVHHNTHLTFLGTGILVTAILLILIGSWLIWTSGNSKNKA